MKTYFPIKKGLLRRTVGYVKAVDGVSFGIRTGRALGLVGESGCGKTTLARSIVRLVPATQGKVVFDRTDVLSADRDRLRRLRSQISLVFQDPFGSLNPRMTVGNIIAEPLKVQRKAASSKLTERVAELLSKVGLSADHINRYPHEFSGGQRQRIGIARALALHPRLIFCDEPVSALDVSIQAQTLNLLQDLQADFGQAYVFVAHDLSVVQHISDRVAVMYVGKIAEMADAEELYTHPLHPYTEALMSAVPKPDPKYQSERIVMKGDVADPSNPPPGCYFHPRCQYAEDVCKTEAPEWRNLRPGHFVACHRAEELQLRGV